MPKPFTEAILDYPGLLDQMSEGIVLLSSEGQILAANAAAKEMLGEDLQEALKKRKILEEREIAVKSHEMGSHVLFVLEDKRELKRLEALVARHDRMKELGDMVAVVAHEIRNPLGGIRGFASLLHRDLSDHPQMQEMAQHIIEGADNLSRFVTNVLNYARPTQAHLETVDLNSFLEELRLHVEIGLKENFSLKIEPSTKPLTALVDAQLLKAALLNLIVNAIQAMPEGGQVTLRTFPKGDAALIEVRDTGVGIAPENREKLFSPFFTTRTEGNGFGLAEVKKIVQAHEGRIEVQSEVGQGTTFTLYLKRESP